MVYKNTKNKVFFCSIFYLWQFFLISRPRVTRFKVVKTH